MSKFKTEARDRVPIGQKAAFGAGHLVLNLYPGALGFFMFFVITSYSIHYTKLYEFIGTWFLNYCWRFKKTAG